MWQIRKPLTPSFAALLWAGVILSFIARWFFGLLGWNEIYASIPAIIICLACLGIYYFSCRNRSFVGPDLHAPENLYYMGLLFTLASLVYSLVSLFVFGDGESDAAGRVYNLVGSFGISLLSTFAGILFRILLLQEIGHAQGPGSADLRGPSQDPLEQRAHKDLLEAAFQLRQELTQTITDMKVFRTTFSQANNETIQEHKKAFSAMAQHIENAVSEQSKLLAEFEKKTRQNLTDAASQLRQELTQTVEEMEAFNLAFTEENNEAVQKSKKAFSDISQSVENTVIEQTRLLSKLTTAATDKLATSSGEAMESINSVKESMNELAAQQARKNKELIAAIDGNVKEAESAFSATKNSLQGMVHDMQSIHNSISAVSTEYGSLGSEIRQIAKVFPDMAGELKQASKTISNESKVFSDSFSETSKALPQYTEQFARLTQALRLEAEKWQSTTNEVRSSIAQSIKELTEVIKRN